VRGPFKPGFGLSGAVLQARAPLACPDRSRRVSRLSRDVEISSKVGFCAKGISFSPSCHPERSRFLRQRRNPRSRRTPALRPQPCRIREFSRSLLDSSWPRWWPIQARFWLEWGSSAGACPIACPERSRRSLRLSREWGLKLGAAFIRILCDSWGKLPRVILSEGPALTCHPEPPGFGERGIRARRANCLARFARHKMRDWRAAFVQTKMHYYRRNANCRTLP
jgi:hypothetical protein